MPQLPMDDIEALQQLMRIQNLFGQPQAVPDVNNDPFDVNNEDVYSQFERLYHPRNEISTQYSQALGQMPVREKPGKLRRLGAALSELSTVGPDTYVGGTAVGFQDRNPALANQIGDEFLNKPYYDKMGDWKNRVDMLGKGAQEEDRYNTNQRVLVSDQVTRETNRKRANAYQQNVTSQAAKREADAKNAAERTQITRDRANAYIFDKEHPDWKPFVQPGGSLVYINPKNPAERYDTGLDSGKMSEEDRINLQTKGRLTAIAASGSEARKTEDVRQQSRMEIQRYKQNNKDFKFIQVKGGNIIGVDPTDPSTVIDTGVKSGTLTDEDKIELGIIGRMDLEDKKEQNLRMRPPKPTAVNQPKTVTREVKDAKGKVQSTTTTTTKVGDNQPKIGDTKTFPNGKIGKWDGKGWVQQ
jgi:hypothetical protein